MFIVANRARKPISRLDDFYAALAAKDEDALEIQQLVIGAGLKVARSTSATAWQAGEISFTSAIAAAIRKPGAKITSAALTNIAVAFPKQKLPHGGAMFAALIRILQRPGLDPDRLLAAMQTRKADEWASFVVGVTSGDERTATLQNAFMDAYEKVPADAA